MQKNGKCLLMFSGGRDSTIAAVRLSRQYPALILATVTAEHLVGIRRVKERIVELKNHLPENTEWLQVAQPALPVPDTLNSATCLPCQRAYVAVGAILAQRSGATHLALGYAKYQSGWPEQTPYATARLKTLLESFGLRLDLPVYDLASKTEAERELIQYGLLPESSEQKCLKQENNVELAADILRKEVDAWEKSTTAFIKAADRIPISVTARKKITEVTA